MLGSGYASAARSRATYKMKISGLVLFVLDVPEMAKHDLIGSREISHCSGWKSCHRVICWRSISEIEAGACVD